MGLFTDVGYSIWAEERRERFVREGREGESLGFSNRPDLNHPWNDEYTENWWLTGILALLFVVGFLGLGLLIGWASNHAG